MPVVKARTTLRPQPHYHLETFTPNSSAWTDQAASMALSFASISGHRGLLDERDLSNVPASTVLAHHQRAIIQDVAAAASTISLFIGLVTVYWFSVMRRRYRHRLIFFLICGDLFRSIWYFVFAWVNISIGPVETSWTFCQATGFFVQTGNEISDLATLSMSLHTALLVFKPWQNVIGDEGLYSFRHTVTAITIMLPLIMASVAFAHHGHGYSAQLPICALPVRPFWFRLALQWVPRYIIWFIVFGLAISVYCYVGGEFRMFSAGAVSSSTSALNVSHSKMISHTLTIGDGLATDTTLPVNDATAVKSTPNTWPPSRRRSSPFSSMTLAAVNEELAPDEVPKPPQHVETLGEVRDTNSENNTTDASNLVSRSDGEIMADNPHLTFSAFEALRALNPRDGSTGKPQRSSLSSDHSPRDQSKPIEIVVHPPTQAEKSRKPLSANLAGAKRRRAIIHQLRLLFVYPILYILLWLIPFILHCYQYSDYYAIHPPFPLTLLAYLSLAIMGAINGIVFNFKERPWRHISGSDGTFVGSFYWWKWSARNTIIQDPRRGEPIHTSVLSSIIGGHSTAESGHRKSTESNSLPFAQKQGFSVEPEATPPSVPVGPSRTVHPRRHRRSEGQKRQANQAYERLAAEMADRQSGHPADTLDPLHDLGARTGSTIGRPMSNWWDRRVSGMSIEEDVEREVRAEQDVTGRRETMEQEQKRRHSTGEIEGHGETSLPKAP